MITALIYSLSFILDMINAIIPAWQPWPDAVRNAFISLGHYAYWLDPWVPMKTFWEIMLYDAGLFCALLAFIIFSRSFRLKIFNKN